MKASEQPFETLKRLPGNPDSLGMGVTPDGKVNVSALDGLVGWFDSLDEAHAAAVDYLRKKGHSHHYLDKAADPSNWETAKVVDSN
ncbi:MAG: hypothetical protein AAF871_13165 [Pseudomonadota bacterium]